MTPSEFRAIRILLKLSQQKMAEYLGIKSGRTVRAWEAGERIIPDYIIKSLAKEPLKTKET